MYFTLKKYALMYKFDIKEFRRANKMTQQELADYLGIGQAYVSNMENGRDKVPDKYIRKILDDPNVDSSMVQIDSDDEVKMSREVFNKMSQLIDTVCSQQDTIAEQHRTIERLIVRQGCDAGANVREDDVAGSADAK